MSFVDQFASVAGEYDRCEQQWFNTYGGYIIETRWNPITKSYETVRHPYNLPNLKYMPDN